MLSNIVKWSIISLMIIGFMHYFYNYFKQNLTTPKVINLSKNESDKKESIKETVKENIQIEVKNEKQPEVQSQSAVMANELNAFLNNELKKN